MIAIILKIGVAAGLMIAGSVFAADMPPLAKKNGCTYCHALDHKVVGPAWMDISRKYQGVKTYKYSLKGSAAPDAVEYPLVEGLMQKISRGGNGNWGAMPMVANDQSGTKQGDIKELVEFILGLSK